MFISPHLNWPHTSSELSVLWLVAATANWVVRCEATRCISVQPQMRWDEARWDEQCEYLSLAIRQATDETNIHDVMQYRWYLSSGAFNEILHIDLSVLDVRLHVVAVGRVGRGEDDSVVVESLEVDRYVVGVGDERRTLPEDQVLDDVVVERHHRSVYAHRPIAAVLTRLFFHNFTALWGLAGVPPAPASLAFNFLARVNIPYGNRTCDLTGVRLLCVLSLYTPCFRKKKHPLILLAIIWGIVVWF